MAMFKGQPITGSSTAMRPKPPVLADAADTSRDAQRLIKQPPAPFANRRGELAPVPSVRLHNYGSPSPSLKPGSWQRVQPNTTPRAGTTPDMLAAVGEPRLPAGYNSINNGFQSRPQRVAGGGKQPNRRGAKLRGR